MMQQQQQQQQFQMQQEQQRKDYAAASKVMTGGTPSIKGGGYATRLVQINPKQDLTKYGEGVKEYGIMDMHSLLNQMNKDKDRAKSAAEFRNKEYFNFRKTYLQSSGGSLLSDTQDSKKFGLVLG